VTDLVLGQKIIPHRLPEEIISKIRQKRHLSRLFHRAPNELIKNQIINLQKEIKYSIA